MENLNEVINSFIESFLQYKTKVPHKQLVPFLKVLYEIACDLENEQVCSNVALQGLLSNLINQESKLCGSSGVHLLEDLLRIIQQRFQGLVDQLMKVKPLEQEQQRILGEIDRLREILEKMKNDDFSDDDLPEITNPEENTFSAICKSELYITHYRAYHPHFISTVIIVLWKSATPGPTLWHEGIPIIYVYEDRNLPTDDFSVWIDGQHEKSPPITNEQIEEAARVNMTIQKYQRKLFSDHSQLMAIRCSDYSNGQYYIELIIANKNFIPADDRFSLPISLDGIQTRVCTGWVEYAGRKEQQFHRPLVPGAGFGVGQHAILNLNVSADDYIPPYIGTLGGFVVKVQGDRYGVSCAHCLCQDVKLETVYPHGTPIYQPCAMGEVVAAASIVPGTLSAYDNLKQSKSLHEAMKWLIDYLECTFHDHVDRDRNCIGTVHGAILGPLADGTTVVDVGLVKISEEVKFKCNQSIMHSAIQSPDLIYEAGVTKLLEVAQFPPYPFVLYGRGARSEDTMQARVNPPQQDIYFRIVNVANRIFKCIHAEVTKNWNLGDSGTWCWTEDGQLVGMGMAYAHIDGKNYCCLLPMENVIAAIQQLTEQ